MIKILLASLLFLTGCTVIGPSERGVRYNFGKVSNDVMQPGTHLWIPYIAGSKTVDLQINTLEFKTSSGTKDQQEVNTLVVVNIQVDNSKVINIINDFGGADNLFETIKPIIHENINANISKFSAEELLTKRAELKANIEAVIREQLTRYNVLIHDVSIKDLQYSKEYSAAIERKQIAEQSAKQAEYETLKVTQDAKAAVAKAKGEAEANKMKQATLTKELIQYEAVLRWNGVLPTVTSGGSGVGGPFLNLHVNDQSK